MTRLELNCVPNLEDFASNLIYYVIRVLFCRPSGGGKSTTVGLIERFYDPSDGHILYLGTDVKTLNVGWYRSQLSYVGQEPVLFDMSIADNISFGTEGVSQADIEEAARQVCVVLFPSYIVRILVLDSDLIKQVFSPPPFIFIRQTLMILSEISLTDTTQLLAMESYLAAKNRQENVTSIMMQWM